MYLRVSTDGQSVETQNDACVRAARAREHRIARVYVESESGDAQRRPELARLMGDVRAGLVETLYVYRLDRLSRAGIQATLAIVQDLDAHNVELITVTDGFTVQGPARVVILAVMAWAAQIELAATRARLAAARTRLEAEVGHWGRPPLLTCAKRDAIRAHRKAGQTLRQISMALKIPKSVVGRACPKNPSVVPLLGTAKKSQKKGKTPRRP